MNDPRPERNVHIIMVPFTGVGTNGGYRGDAWYADRVSVFQKTCLASLRNQSCKNFMLWLTFRPEERTHPTTQRIREMLDAIGCQYIMTFDGLMYFDDKFSRHPMVLAKNFARGIRDSLRTKQNRMFGIWSTKNDTLVDRVRSSLAVIKEEFTKNGIEHLDWVFLSRIDSDDMFHRDFMEELTRWNGFPGVYRLQRGYIYNGDTKEIASWHPKTNPPFHTIVFPYNVFLDAEKHVQYYRGYESHEDVKRLFPCVRLRDGLYCVYTHNPKMHLSTTWDHPYKGDVITDEKIRDELIAGFGLNSL